eukprot:364443-Chlamydomonas_euryale.AAC.1
MSQRGQHHVLHHPRVVGELAPRASTCRRLAAIAALTSAGPGVVVLVATAPATAIVGPRLHRCAAGRRCAVPDRRPTTQVPLGATLRAIARLVHVHCICHVGSRQKVRPRAEHTCCVGTRWAGLRDGHICRPGSCARRGHGSCRSDRRFRQPSGLQRLCIRVCAARRAHAGIAGP